MWLPVCCGALLGCDRADTQWREADFEWLGVSPSEVQVTIFEKGQNDPSAMELKLREVREDDGGEGRSV